MQITVHADKSNTKTILTLLEEMGYSLPCNCHGGHLCDGRTYPFDCSMVPRETVCITLPGPSTENLSGISLEDSPLIPGPADTLLVDLGTTTVALALISRATGELRQTYVFPNPQRQFGSDIISRIQASLQGKRNRLKELITSELSRTAALLCQKNNQTLSCLSRCYIAGNTAMIHLLMGYDCTPLVEKSLYPGADVTTSFLSE